MRCAECAARGGSLCSIFGREGGLALELERLRQFTVQPKRVVFREGDLPNEVFRVQSGWGMRFKVLANGTRQILSFVLPGDFLSLELLQGEPLRFSTLTLTSMTLCAFSREHAARDAFANSRNAMAVARQWGLHVADLDRALVLLGRMPAAGRIAGLVLEIYGRLSRRGMTVGREFAFPLRHEDLADALGLTPAHVSRTLTSMRQDNLLEIRASRASILDYDGLQKLAS